jgi:hypothetical protein
MADLAAPRCPLCTNHPNCPNHARAYWRQYSVFLACARGYLSLKSK